MDKNSNTLISWRSLYSLFKKIDSKFDPYTRFAFGALSCFAMGLSLNNIVRYIGVGTGIVGAFQVLDVHKGGRLVKNNSSFQVYVLDEKYAITKLEPGEIPSNTIVGFTLRGINGVFKVTDGIYVQINLNGSISYTPGLGKLINQNIRSGGLKSKDWVANQQEKHWEELFNNSIA
jgi:hypothetical protein